MAALIGAGAYLESLADGRCVWLDGARVPDVAAHPLLAKSAAWVASTYQRFEGEQNPVYRVPRDESELCEQVSLLVGTDRTTATTAGCMALSTLAGELDHGERLQAFADGCAARDVRVAAAADSTARPLRIVARRPGGIVVSGGKQHVVGAAVVHELVAVPSGRPGDGGEDAAVACAVPLAAPGVRVVATTTAPRAADDRHYPLSRSASISEAVVVFDEVFVPDERVFLDGQVGQAARLASTLSVWERARAVADQADRAELLLGLAQTIAEMNGIDAVSHVRDKLSAMAVYSTMCRAGWESALAHAKVTSGGMVCPDDACLHAAKAYGGHLYSEMVGYLHDIAGGLVITCPTIADLDNPETGDYLRKYLRTMENVSGEDRMRIFHAIRDLTADTYGGWDKVTNQVVGGGMHAQRMAALDAADLASAKARALAAAGIEAAT